MSNVIETEVPDSRSPVADRPPRPALREALQQIAAIAQTDETAVVTDRSIEFENAGQRTTISAVPIDVDTVHGYRITDMFTIRTPLTAFTYADENDYSFVNAFATTGAIVRDSDGEDAIVSRLPLFEGDDETLSVLYVPLIAEAARLQAVGAFCGLSHSLGHKEDFDAATLELPGWDEPSYWSAAEFESASERLRERGAFANAGASGLTVEFPWTPGAISTIAGHCTSLLEIRADSPHPAAGNGLFYLLRLPLNLTAEAAVNHAAGLNRIEAESVDTPPFFGAWCALPGSGTLSFTGFWPNLLYMKDTVTTLAAWNWARSRFARQVIGNL